MHPRMSYIDSPDAEPAAGSGSRKYVGDVARDYDKKRESSEKWKVEQEAVEFLLADYPQGSWVLDAPCGTGRFFPYYEERGFIVRGFDLSAEMMAIAGKKIKDPVAMIDGHQKWGWRQGDITEGTGLDPKSVDVAVCVRMTRWIMGNYGEVGVAKMLNELARVARKAIIITARVKDHKFMVPYDLISIALPEWEITRDLEGSEEAYRIIELRPHEVA